MPRLVRVLLSPDGVRFQSPSAGVQVVPARDEADDDDEADEAAREVVAQLGGRPARSVRVQLFFAATWILLSEVTFDSGEAPRPVLCTPAVPSARPVAHSLPLAR